MAQTFNYLKACFVCCMLQGFFLVIKAQPVLSANAPINQRPFSSTAFYVKESATGNNDGTSWQDAFTSFASALQAAVAGDTIRVAEGTYKPAGISFILKDSVVILGGYSNLNLPSDAERNWGLYQTILSGETGNPAFTFDNLSNIINGNGLHHSTVLDGFIIEKGFANNTVIGVGIHLVNSDPVIKNCVFRGNSSYNSSLGGSSIACFNDSDPEISNCFFVNNLDLGYGTIFAKQNSKPKLTNCVFAANDGRCVVYTNQSEAHITNCTFFKNQLGNAMIPFNIRPGFIYAENGSALSVANTIFFDNRFLLSLDTSDISLNASTVDLQNSITQNFATGNNLQQAVDPRFKNGNSVAGPDNLYFTTDDGLQPESCSPAVNTGNNTVVTTLETDLLLQPRIYAATADIGAYEYQSGPAPEILSAAGDSLIANREFTDANGWTNYYKDCQLLLSVKKNGQSIGTVNDGHFKVVVKTLPGYGTGNVNDLSQAFYVSPGIAWSALNRFWYIHGSIEPMDSMRIRFPWSSTDFSDAVSINPMLSAAKQLVFYTIDSPFQVLDTNVPPPSFHAYFNDVNASTTTWIFTETDAVKFAEYYVKKLSAGGIGTGNGSKFGPYAAVSVGCAKANRKLVSNLSGDFYQWQVNNGGGFTDIADDDQYIGVTSQQMIIKEPASNTYGRLFRCRVIQGGTILFTTPTVLKFETRWKGSVSSSWSDVENWSCNVLPDENTDVYIEANPLFYPELDMDAVCRSVHLLTGSKLTVLDGKTLTITGHQ